MDPHVVIELQDMVHSISLWLIGLIVVIAVFNILKPSIFEKFMFEFGERKYVVSTCVFIGLLCSTVFVATQPNVVPSTYGFENTKQTVSAVDIIQSSVPEITSVQQAETQKADETVAPTPASESGTAPVQASVDTPPPAQTEAIKNDSKPSSNSKPENKSGRSLLPKIELTCKKDKSSAKSTRTTICLYKS